MGNSQSQDRHPDAVPEFEVTRGDDGRLRARHKGTGEIIEAADAAELERRAMAKRVAISWRQGKKR